MTVVINTSQISEREFRDIGNIEYSPTIKYGSPEFVIKNSSDQVRSIIQEMLPNINNKHNNVIIDVKVHDLKLGEMPCMNNWHMDCVGRHDEEFKEECHHLIIFGDCSRTIFLCDSITLENVPNDKVINWNKVIDLHPYNIFQIKPNHIYTYGRNLHRGAPATKDGRRLLIRITETDKIKPQNIKRDIYTRITD